MLLWGMSCVKAQTSDVDKMFPNVVLTRENYDKVKTALEKADNTAFPMNWYIKQIETPGQTVRLLYESMNNLRQQYYMILHEYFFSTRQH